MAEDEIGELAQSFNKMSADLASAANIRRQMTADIAHELRTPLSLIIGHAEGVHDGVLEPTRETFEIIREEAERLEHLVNDLRTLSLADAGELIRPGTGDCKIYCGAAPRPDLGGEPARPGAENCHSISCHNELTGKTPFNLS
jgi:signal transduction histidine kinase